jgi:hypothetical protein
VPPLKIRLRRGRAAGDEIIGARLFFILDWKLVKVISLVVLCCYFCTLAWYLAVLREVIPLGVLGGSDPLVLEVEGKLVCLLGTKAG